MLILSTMMDPFFNKEFCP